MYNCLYDDDFRNPAMENIESPKTPAGEPNERVVPAPKQPEERQAARHDDWCSIAEIP